MDRLVSRIARSCGALAAIFLVVVCVAPEETFRTPGKQAPLRDATLRDTNHGKASHGQLDVDIGPPSSGTDPAASREGPRVRVSATQHNLRRLPAATGGSNLSTISSALPPSTDDQRVEPVADSIAPTTESGEPNSKTAPDQGNEDEPSLAPLEPEPQPAIYTTGDGRRLAAANEGSSWRSILVVPGASLTLPTSLEPAAQPSLPAATGTIISFPMATGLAATRANSPSASPQPTPAPALGLAPPQNPSTKQPSVAQSAPAQLVPHDPAQDDSLADPHHDAQQVVPEVAVETGMPDAESPVTESPDAESRDAESRDTESADNKSPDAADDRASVTSSGTRAVAAQQSTGIPAPLMVTNQWVQDESKPKLNPTSRVAPTSSKAPLEPPMPAAPPTPAAPASPVVPPVPGDLPVDVQRRVQQELTTGFSLAERGAVFSAQARFLQALTWIAQSHDQQSGGGQHTQAMQQGLQALDEIKDLVGLAANSTGGTDLAHVVHYHRTRVVSESELSKLTPQMLAERYREFARQQLVAATGRSSTASKTLFGLAKLQSVLQSPGAQDANLRDARAQAFYQAALDADTNNFPAANELGVLLSRQGRPDEALVVLRQAARVGGSQPQVWHNLAAVHRQLGQSEQAQLAEAEKQKLQGGPGGRAGTTLPPVTWVSPDQFAANSPPEGQWGRNAATAASVHAARGASSTASTANATAAKEMNQAKATQSDSAGRSFSQRWNPWRRAPQSESNDATRWR